MFFCVIIGINSAAAASDFKDETLHYVISYKWGLINKDAGEATLTLRNSGNRYNLRLVAKTLPWADHYFKVRDTLIATVDKNRLLPLSYSKISHEGGDYRRDDITFSRQGSKTTAKVKRHRVKDNGQSSSSNHVFYANGTAYDMLSVFYYLRTLDYSALEKSRITRTSIFSGSQVETLTIRYAGRKTISLRGGHKREAIKIAFSFTTDGRKKSSESMEAWVAADASHIPLEVIGKLPIGSVRVNIVE